MGRIDMSETTAAIEFDYGISKLIARAAFIKEDAAIMGRELSPSERQVMEFVDNLTTTHGYVWWDKGKMQTLKTPDGTIWVHVGMGRYRGIDALMDELQKLKKEAMPELPTGWLCPRCGARGNDVT